MIGFHLAVALFGFRWIFRDPEVDVRLLWAGALLPDLIDLPLGTWLLSDYATGELWLHTPFVIAVIGMVVLVFTRRSPSRRKWFTLLVGMLFHLLADAVWTNTTLFLWPFAGDIPRGSSPYWAGIWERAFADPWRWLLELAGWTYLVGLGYRIVWQHREVRTGFYRTGRLPARPALPSSRV